MFKSLTLDGNGRKVTISGGGRSQIFFMSGPITVVMRGFTMQDGAGLSFGFGGGAMFFGGTRLVVDDMRFLNNKAGVGDSGGDFFSGAGGAISVFGPRAELVVTKSEFAGNSAICGLTCAGGGGALSLRSGGSSLIQTSIFRDNHDLGGDGGGAIAASYTNFSSLFTLSGGVTIDRSTFVNNRSDTSPFRSSDGRPTPGGGAIVSLGHPLTITASTFNANIADVNIVFGVGIQSSGGAVRSGIPRFDEAPRWPTSITGSTFVGNAARGTASQGGAISVDDQPVRISASVLTKNTADRGAALNILGDGVTIANSQFVANISPPALGEPGAVWTAGNTTFAGTQLLNNTAGCYLAFDAKVIDQGRNVERPGNSCGFR